MTERRVHQILIHELLRDILRRRNLLIILAHTLNQNFLELLVFLHWIVDPSVTVDVVAELIGDLLGVAAVLGRVECVGLLLLFHCWLFSGLRVICCWHVGWFLRLVFDAIALVRGWDDCGFGCRGLSFDFGWPVIARVIIQVLIVSPYFGSHLSSDLSSGRGHIGRIFNYVLLPRLLLYRVRWDAFSWIVSGT